MLRETLQDRLVDVAKAAGGEHLIELLLSQARECGYIFVGEQADAQDIGAGASRLGGLPDLPMGVTWPSGVDEHGKPWHYADFVAQLNFTQIPAIADLLLPSQGRLWLFMAAWRKTEAVLTTICDPSGTNAVSQREAPTTTEWAGFSALELEQDRPLSLGTVPLRFEIGVSLPFGDGSFERAMRQTPRVRNAIQDALVPKTFQGQIGGYAYDTAEGHNHRLNVELAQRGMRDYLFPFTYETVAELDRVIPDLPDWQAKKPAYVDKLRADLEKLRPRVEWIEQHRAELNEWQPFVSFHANYDIDLSWGTDTSSLWTFIRTSDLAIGRFDHIVGETVE